MRTRTYLLLPALSVFSAACTTTTTEIVPAPPTSDGEAEDAQTSDGSTDEPTDDGNLDVDASTPEESAPEVIPQVIFSGQFSKVDVTYQRASKFIVLDLKGTASGLSASLKDVSISKIAVAKTTSYELLYPPLGNCDAPPELTIEKGSVNAAMQRAGEPNATISGCYYLASYIKASDGGFQARLTDVPIKGGGTITELLLDISGPTN